MSIFCFHTGNGAFAASIYRDVSPALHVRYIHYTMPPVSRAADPDPKKIHGSGPFLYKKRILILFSQNGRFGFSFITWVLIFWGFDPVNHSNENKS